MRVVKYKFVDSLLGKALVAECICEGVSKACYVSLPKAKSDAAYVSELQRLYPEAEESGSLQCETEVVSILNGNPPTDSLSVQLDGPEFSVAVWTELMNIPFGKVASYAEVANAIGRPTAYRAVAQACSRNHLAVLVPCHRVVASNGDISGFGWGVENKKMLLKREGYMKYE